MDAPNPVESSGRVSSRCRHWLRPSIARLRRLLQEPLIHFLAIGAALFAFSQWSAGGSGQASKTIVLTSGQIQHMAAGFTKVWQRPPTESDLKGLIDDWVREEIAVRAAVEAGLDRDDTVIRRRLRQKLEFLTEDLAEASAPTEQDLQAWFSEHANKFQNEPRVAFRQVFVSRERRGVTAEADAIAILDQLKKNPDASIDGLGDPTMLPLDIGLEPFSDVGDTFGPGFAGRINALTPGAWAGPVSSTYGLHLVLVLDRAEGTKPDFSAVRAEVERELMLARRKQALSAMYERLLKNYTVVIERAASGNAAARKQPER